MVDIARPELKRKKRIRRIIYGAVGLVVVVVITVALTRLKPAAPSVDKATTWPGTVARGDMVLAVQGIGDLEPETIWTVSAAVDGRIIKRYMLAGQKVKADSVILDLANPKLEEQARGDKSLLDAAKSTYIQTKATLQNQLAADRAAEAQADATNQGAQMTKQNDEELNKLGLKSNVETKTAELSAAATAKQEEIAKQEIETFEGSIAAQLAVQQAAIDKAQDTYNQDLQQLQDLHIRPGIDGVLQELESPGADVGAYAAAGTLLAKVVQPSKLKAVLKISETQANVIQIGQKATVDTHNGVIPGHVTRIDPSATNGTRSVDVQLDGALPDGAVPQLSVEGTVIIEQLHDVLYVDRPMHAEANSTVQLFKETDGGSEAIRVPVQIGKVSVDKVEILKGLNVGDVVILSDMSAQDSYDRIELK